jgi:hypothetical protein
MELEIGDSKWDPAKSLAILRGNERAIGIMTSIGDEKPADPCATASNDKAVEAILAEYNVLRSEINLYHEQQKQVINYALLTFLAFFTIATTDRITSAANNTPVQDFLPNLFPLLILSAPMIIIIFGLLYVDRTIRIRRIASYIDSYMRPLLISYIHCDVWHWEIYKRVTGNEQERTYRLAHLLDKVRLLIFTLPCVLALIIYFTTMVPPRPMAEYVIIACDLAALALLAYVSTSIDETSGAYVTKPHLVEKIHTESQASFRFKPNSWLEKKSNEQ